MATVNLSEAGRRLSMTPLEVVVRCALRGVQCESGLLEADVLPVLGPVLVNDGEGETRPGASAIELTEADLERERRRRIVRRVLDKLRAMPKFWPARIEMRSTARGFAAADVGLALRAVDVLVECGIMKAEVHGGHEPRVGLDGARRAEIESILAGDPIADDRLRDWVDNG
jgi:hypothetical protein